MSWAKYGILAVVVGTAGLAVHHYYGKSSARSRDQKLLEQMRKRQASHLDDATLLARLGDRPHMIRASDLSGIDGLSVLERKAADPKAADDSGSVIKLDNPDGKLHDDLAKAWGKPIERKDDKDDDEKYSYWFGETPKVRAILFRGHADRTELDIGPYTPLAPLIDQVTGYIGKPASDLSVANGDTSPAEMDLPPSEYSNVPTQVKLWLTDGRVSHATISTNVVNDRESVYGGAFFVDIARGLSAKRGKPKMGRTADRGERYDFPGQPPIRVEFHRDHAMTIFLGQQEPARP